MEYKIIQFETIDSTNDYAKQIGSIAEEGTVIVAKEQTKGRGRLGRKWESPKNKGLYFSIILRPNIEMEHIQNITLITSLAVYRALKKIGIGVQIKWPNDIVKNHKKIAGILTEIRFKGDTIEYLVVGIGINIGSSGWDVPEDLLNKASSLKMISDGEIDERSIFDKILEEFKILYEEFKRQGLTIKMIEEIKKNSSILNREIEITKGNSTRKGMPIDINNKGELIVRYENGIEVCSSGEISLRNNYK